jgi:hypothetical protein
MKTTTNLKSWSNGALMNLILGYALHGARDTRDVREMIDAKDELKRRGVSWEEIKGKIASEVARAA